MHAPVLRFYRLCRLLGLLAGVLTLALPHQAAAQSSANGFQSVLQDPAPLPTGLPPTGIPQPAGGPTIEEIYATTPQNPLVNAGSIYQRGNFNTATQTVIGIANNVLQVQDGNRNSSNIAELATRNTNVGVYQKGDDLELNILLLGSHDTSVLHLQSGIGGSQSIMVLGDLGVVVGGRFVPNTTGKPISSVIIRDRK